MLSLALLLTYLVAMGGCVSMAGRVAGFFLALILRMGWMKADWDWAWTQAVHFAGWLLLHLLSEWFLRAQ